MEILSSSFLPNPNFLSSISFLSPTTTSLATLSKKTPYKFRKTHLKSSPNPPFLTNSPLQNNKISHINARFGRPTKRRNSLRKKLRESDSQVREYPQKVIDPVHHFVDNQVYDSNLVSNNLESESVKIGSSQIDSVSNNLEKSRQFGESVLWDKLEGWVEQYKKDIEFWGIGSKTIFTVFQDSDGNVERVLVDEDEIMRRSGVEPLYYREESEFEVFDEVNSRLSHAKFLARELEGGKNVIPKNSSVTKFVVSGEKSGFVSRIKSVFVPRTSLAKVSKVGIAVVCGFVFVWVIKKLFTVGGEETERTSFEKEMLRRKIKSRMEKEKLRKGTVEVMEEPADPPIVITERPLIDKEVVLNSIREAKGMNNSLVVLDAGGTRETASVDMDTKIHEIQMMARHARKIERGEESPSEGGEVDEQIPNEMQSVEKDTVEGHEELMIDESEKQVSNVSTSIVEIENAAEEHAGVDMDLMNNLLSEQSAETRVFNGIKKRSGDADFASEKDSEGNEDVESPSILSGRVIDDKKSHIDTCIQSHDTSSSSNLTEGIQSFNLRSQLNSSKKAPLRRKPKIIRSVKEAREYLLQKQDQQSQVGDIPTTAAVKDEEMDSYFRQRLGEDGKAPESFDVDRIVDPVSAPKAFEIYAEKQNELLATSTNGFQNETESGLKKIRTSDRPTAENSDVDTALHLGKTMKTSEMLNPNDSRQRSDHIPGEKDSCGASEEVPLLAEQSSEEVDKLHERPKPSDLSEISDLASGRNASHDASKSTEESGVLHENVVHDANLQNKVYLSNDGINRTVNLTEFYETFIPGVVGRDLNGSASVEYASQPLEIKDEDKYRKNHVESKFSTAETFQDSVSSVDDREGELLANKEKWLEKNFHEVEPIVNKIGSGFRNNYNVAREKIKELDTGLDLMTLRSIKDSTELEWMQDDKLREIVFRVRDNELAGRDPFHSMNPEDKAAFLKGLESKVEKENQKLSILHEWIHSNIENVDYGADGISIYDPPEKVIPRWKGPPLDDISEFLNNSKDQQVAASLQKVEDTIKHDNFEASQEASISKSTSKRKVAKVSKTVIEASDGSIKPGKKSGKEFWQHTKKWSRGFVESYNAETDPEVKSTMKDIGKDLDRWITEEEIQDAADLMDKVPQKGKEFIEKKLNKVKREMELFGPQAVVSKYREYAEDKEEDYLWWLDLPHLLCIEMYNYEGEEQKVGFYSLEMAGDLEIEPKPQHVIAFEDPGDSKNFCYIMQSHLEMLGKGKAFIVPQPPKDVFWQAKANGFGVTVIRKGELKLNVDQLLEEVEELITEIGSKMYHDKIMRERSVDINSLMKGVFGVSPPSKRRRKKRARKRPSKS